VAKSQNSKIKRELRNGKCETRNGKRKTKKARGSKNSNYFHFSAEIKVK